MKIEDVVEALNKCILDERKDKDINANSFLVLHRQITPTETFKAYKNFKYTLYCISKKNKFPIVEYNKSFRIISEDDYNNTINNMEMELCVYLFKWKNTYNYEQLIAGNYETT